jgi:GNAT superfamily N-acetyltransferase
MYLSEGKCPTKSESTRMSIPTPRPLESHEQEACLDLWDAGFTNTPRDFFVKYFQHDASYQHGDTIVMEVGGRLVSTVHVVRREAYTKAGIIGVGGIANVATHPDFRGRGYNSACLNAMISHLDADPFFDMSLLGTGIHDYYAKFGWTRWPIPVQKFMPKSLSKTTEIIPATEADLPQIQALYAAYNQHQPLTFCRNSVNYWEDWLQWTPKNFFLTPNKDTYARLVATKTNEGESWHVIQEIGGSIEGFQNLFTSIVAQAHQEKAVYVTLAAPPSQELSYLMGQFGENITQEIVEGWMVRPHKSNTLPDLTNGYFYGADGF